MFDICLNQSGWRGLCRSVLFRLVAWLAAAFFVAGQAHARETVAARVQVGGTGSGSALIERLAEDYRKARPGADVKVVMPVLGSSGGLRALALRRIDVAVVGRLPTLEELRDGLVAIPWAETPLVLVTSNGRKASGFDVAAFAGILRKGRGTWDDGTRLHLVLRQPSEADNAILSSAYPEIKRALGTALRNPALAVADTDFDAIDLLTRIPGSLGTTTLGMLRITGSRLTVLSFNGVEPSLAALRYGSYPIGKKLYLVHAPTLSGPAADFVTWLKSPAVATRLQELEHLALQR